MDWDKIADKIEHYGTVVVLQEFLRQHLQEHHGPHVHDLLVANETMYAGHFTTGRDLRKPEDKTEVTAKDICHKIPRECYDSAPKLEAKPEVCECGFDSLISKTWSDWKWCPMCGKPLKGGKP